MRRFWITAIIIAVLAMVSVKYTQAVSQKTLQDIQRITLQIHEVALNMNGLATAALQLKTGKLPCGDRKVPVDPAYSDSLIKDYRARYAVLDSLFKVLPK